MSDLKEKEEKVLVTTDDVNAAYEFWAHFKVPVKPEFEQAIKLFNENPTVETQKNLKLWLCKSISETDHPTFKDEMFSKIVEECRSVAYDLEFDKQFEETVSTKKDE